MSKVTSQREEEVVHVELAEFVPGARHGFAGAGTNPDHDEKRT